MASHFFLTELNPGLALMDRAPDAAMARQGGRLVTAAEFLDQVHGMSRRLPQARYAINLCEDRYRFMLGFAAAIAAGQTNLLPPNRLPATVDWVRRTYPDSYLLDDSRVSACTLSSSGGDVPRIPFDHLAAIVFTSGSTGRPQAIHKPWRTFVDSTRLNARELGVADAPAELLATVPPQHMYGLETSVLLPLFAPVTVCSSRPFFPDDIARALGAMDAPRVLVSTPVHLRALEQARTRLPAVERIWSATAPLDAALAEGLEVAYRTGVTEIFGCSETGCLARREPVRDTDWRPFEGFDIRRDGESFLVTALHLPAPVPLQDHLEFGAGGRFRLLGRGSDMVNIAGKRASLCELNRHLLAIPGVRDGVIFDPAADGGEAPRLAALVVAPELTARDIRKALSPLVDGAFLPRPIRLVDALPRAETGKLCRGALVDLFQELR